MNGTSALGAALRADTEHVVSFCRDGGERRWPDLLIAAAQVAGRVAEAGGTRWAIDLDDAFEFAAALVGCWAARKTPVLAPRTMLEATGGALAIDGVVRSDAGDVSAPRRVLWSSLRRAPHETFDVEPDAELVLYTSGSTGDPKAVARRLHNIEAELAELESLWGTALGTSRVYSTVSHRHVYGMLFRVLWPLLNRRPFASFDFEYPEQLLGAHAEGCALVSSPALLKRIGHLPAGSAAWREVFSSGGLLPAPAAADALRVLGACPVEVFGSTETSGVAWRRQTAAHATSWRTMAPVETRTSADGLLEVRSPFTGRPGWLQMGDLVQLSADGTFELLGRGDHLAKIEDKRVSLAEIERCLLATPWVADAAAVAMEDSGRQYVGAVIKLNADGREQLASNGRRGLSEMLKNALRAQVERVAVPRKLRYVDDVPVDSQGKRRANVLRDLVRAR
jgi:acyl-coenzyme A synthetase/AMP-(fatty) acid ligase